MQGEEICGVVLKWWGDEGIVGEGIKSWKAGLIKRHGLWATYHSLYVYRYERLDNVKSIADADRS